MLSSDVLFCCEQGSRVSEYRTITLSDFEQTVLQQIRPTRLRPLDALRITPSGHRLMVAREQNFWNFTTVPLAWSGVVGAIEQRRAFA